MASLGQFRFVLLSMIACVLASTGRAQDAQYVGSEVCLACHTAIAQSFNRNPHFESVAKGGRQPPADTGCEGCHGPGSAHIAGGGNPAAIIRFDRLAPSAVLDRCLSCHADDLGKMRIRRSSHSTGEISCVSCHSVHGSSEIGPLLATREVELCYTCHIEVRAQFNLPFKHRVNEGSMKCSDCHNPHGAPEATWAAAGSRNMVRHAAGNDIVCVGCHTDKRGPFVYEHAPIRVEGCATCHNPHGSTNARLLTRPAAFTMCLECHNGVSEFGTRLDGVPNPTVGFHNLANAQFQNCVVCHSRIHGSNSDRLLRR